MRMSDAVKRYFRLQKIVGRWEGKEKMMKRVMALAVGILWLCTAGSNADVIALHSDLMRSDCTATLTVWDGMVLYLFHYSPGGATGSRFVLPREIAFGNIEGPWLVDEQFPHTGVPEQGIEFHYGSCKSGLVYVTSVVYYDVVGLGGWPVCREQRILAHPSSQSGQAETITCVGTAEAADPFHGMLSYTPGCPCPTVTGVASQSRTWGAIKSVFAQ
jgi:hypothetical protein